MEIAGEPNYYERQHPDRSARRLIRRLEQLGFDVDAKRKAAQQQTAAPTPTATELIPAADPMPRARRSKRAKQPTEPRARAAAESTDSVICRKCAGWGIECFHARNAKRRAPTLTPCAKSAT